MPKRTRPYRESLLEDLQDPNEAASYLNAALEDSAEMFLVALRDVADARHMATVAAQIGVARETLYRMLSERGNPTYNNLSGLLDVFGVRIRLEPIITNTCSNPSGAEKHTGVLASAYLKPAAVIAHGSQNQPVAVRKKPLRREFKTKRGVKITGSLGGVVVGGSIHREALGEAA